MQGTLAALAILVTCAESQLTGGTVEPAKACLTPKGKEGECVNIRQCPELLQMLLRHKELGVTDYLKRSQCGTVNRDILVCCPPRNTSAPNEQYISGGTEEQKTEKRLNTPTLPYDVCGQSDIFRPKHDGANAALGAYPWMAALGFTEKGSTRPVWRCAGSLITDQYVLTTAQCVKTSNSLVLTHVRLGDLDLNDTVDDGASPVDIEVENSLAHPDHRALLSHIALVKMKTKVQFDYTKKPICLPPPDFYVTSLVGHTAALIGWGKGFSGNTGPLQETAVSIEDLESCKAHYRRLTIDERVFCAGDHGRDVTCRGDFGGPLMVYRRYRGQDRMFILGIVSFKKVQCGLNSTSPGGYTNVSTFLPWILSHLDL